MPAGKPAKHIISTFLALHLDYSRYFKNMQADNPDKTWFVWQFNDVYSQNVP
jgi:uncharacterized short protein YbdD (DUF466 family)